MKKNTKIVPFAPKAIIAATAQKAQERAEVVRETAQNIWFAGLGALSLAEDQGGKAFQALVKRGASLDARNRKALSAIVKDVEARVEIVRERVSDATHGTRSKFELGVERIGTGVESGVATVMHTLGVPTRSEIQTLTRKVDALTKSVEKKSKTARKAPAKRTKAVSGASISGTPAF
jgi:poly(hydroxyalkanoate) granule-associated protein